MPAIDQHTSFRGPVYGRVWAVRVNEVLLLVSHDELWASLMLRVVAGIEMHDFYRAPPSARGPRGGGQLRIVVVEVPVRVRARHIGRPFLPVGRAGIRSARRHGRRV